MQGSLYPDGVTVDQVALRRTELTKTQEILRNRIDWTCRGVYSGGVISINTSGVPPYLNIDITQAAGFAPNGEFVQTDSAYYNIPLADYTLGVVNYVCLVYTEANSFRQPHESDGSRYYTRSEMAWRVRIYTAAQYAALPASDENLANDAQDRIILFGKVTAAGPGISLTTASIESPRTFNNIMYTVPKKCLVILGVEVLAASSGSPLGSGTLSYTYTPGTPPLYDFQWTTSNGAGALVNVTTDGTYTILDGAGEWIKILVSLAVLPTFLVATTITETITIHNLYYQEMPRLSAEDWLHRNYTGTGVISPTNPHGLSLDDISGESLSLLDEHQDVLHCNGIWRGSSVNLFRLSINNLPGSDTLSLIPPSGGDLYYVNGVKLDTIDLTTVTITPPAVQSAYLYEICVSDEATVEYVQKAAYPVARTVTGTWIVDMSKDYPSGSAVLTCTTAGAFSPKVFTWDGGAPVTFTPLTDPSQALRLYAADGEHWIDLWVNTNPSPNPDESLPVANVSDTIAIFASLTDGTNQFMQIGAALYWYSSSSVKWVLGYHPLSASRNAVDKRIWGTTGTENMSTWALEDLAYLPNNELGRSGALLRRNGVYNEFNYTYGGTGFAIDVNGGSFYCRGQRISVRSVQTLVTVPSSIQLIWADMTGTYNVVDVTGSYSGDIQAAMRYVLGFTQNIPSVSADYHYSDTGDAPERGILLYYVETDATDITRIVDFTQNVNCVDDPWSVGSRATTLANSVHAQAAYDTLFTAFEYAKYSMYGTENKGAVTLTVIGSVDVAFKITQPEYVNVRGTRGISSPSKSVVRVAGTDYWGSWVLSAGCKISDLSVYFASSTNTHAAIALNHYTTVEECFFASLGGAIFVAGVLAMTSCNGVVLRNNTSAGAPFLLPMAYPNGITGWIISGNEILAVPAGLFAGIRLWDCKDIIISDNVVSVPDSNDGSVGSCPGISVSTMGGGFQCQGVTIRDNFISVGNNAPAQTNSVAGIYLNDVWLSTISGNVITRATGSTTQIGVGIYFDGLAQCSIVDNKIGLMGGGIYGIGYLYDTEISRNKMQGLFQVAISVVVNYFPVLNSTYGLRIEQNDIYVMAKGLNGGLFANPDLYGIVVASDLSISNSALSGFSVSNNLMSGLGSPVSGSGVYGVLFDVETGAGFCKSIRIDDNCIDSIFSGTGALGGISFDVSLVSDAESVSLSRNRISFTSATTSASVNGMYVSAFLSGGCIDNNAVVINCSDDTAYGIALYHTGTPTSLRISGNIFYGMAAGVYAHASSKLIVSDNYIYGKGVGLHLSNTPSENTLVHGNTIRVDAYIDDPWAFDVDYPGAHCFSIDADSPGVTLHNNVLYLNGVTRPGVGVNDVPAGSACAIFVRPSSIFMDGCLLKSDTETVDGADGTPPDRAFLLYLQAGHDAINGKKTTCSVSNNFFDDRVEDAGTTRTPLHALFVQPEPGFDHSSKDSLYMSVKGNTFYTSNFKEAPFGGYEFNLEGRDGTTAPANAPYTIYVSYAFGDPDATPGIRSWSHVYFVGNSIYAVGDYAGIPYVYMPFYTVLFPLVVGETGPCHYEEDSLANFTNWNNSWPACGLTAWPGP